MAVANEIMQQQIQAGEILSKVILGQDLSCLNSVEKVKHINNICNTMGLNPLTQPIQLMKLQGKETPYVTKGGTEQLRKIHKVSITSIETKIIDGLYIVTAHAVTPDGRSDVSTAALPIANLKGEALGNAMMKCETKAKRRLTLSICGLGFIDESEVDSIPGAQKIEVKQVNDPELIEDRQMQVPSYIYEIENSKTMDDLIVVFKNAYKLFKDMPNELEKIIISKDKRKEELKKTLRPVIETWEIGHKNGDCENEECTDEDCVDDNCGKNI